MTKSLLAPCNADPKELQKFSALSSQWWDPRAEFKALHALNPVRLNWMLEHVNLSGTRAVDIGCGGGILAESMARCGAQVTGIDLSEATLAAARHHMEHAQAPNAPALNIRYESISAEALADREAGTYDVVSCMEMLEHVPDPAAIVTACAALLKPGGWVFFSTLDRSLKSYLLAIIAAEYIARLLPRGTHDYERFIRPAELAAFARQAGLSIHTLTGAHYHPLGNHFTLSASIHANYLLACRKPLTSALNVYAP